ncbi:hypothetical protein SKTS_17110 [Sulfurimicrobium lacus]|uniref:diguanylate cyclase n=1 Tax=Sulfurimicrobium lacus TaxID=2715678 RepID=A0A6F8VDI7_9PROT|nr:diguanylate cyclase response regulator [Sulfurimicrobium lacus]BCB26825.1 hypothetical protein SKTS_17110 [Sulfurimicrobium lacus]
MTVKNPPCRVLLVEDDPGDAHLVRQTLNAAGAGRFDITWVGSLAEARQQLRDNPPDVLLLDLSLPDSSGLATVLAGREAAGALPLIVLTGHDDNGFEHQTLETGAHDYLVKGSFTSDGLIRAIRHAIIRARLEAELRALASTDYLTGLPNRRHFFTQMETELARMQRLDGERAAVLMLDLDHFKRVNDHFGHATGDALLKHFATLMKDELRKIDSLGRVGGEEFAILLPAADPEAARSFAERLRQKVEETPLVLNGQPIPITVSIGVAIMEATDGSADAALIRADKALYRAKEGGRNRVEIDPLA